MKQQQPISLLSSILTRGSFAIALIGCGMLYDRMNAPAAQTDLRSLLGDTSGQTMPPFKWDQTPTPTVWPQMGPNPDAPVMPYGPEPRDGGGALYRYFGAVMRADMLGQKVRISGTCISACTVYLGARNVCVEPDAVLWFHAAHVGGRVDETATREMASYWPESVRAWAESAGATKALEFTRRRSLTGSDLIAMGMRACS
jgi:hypothetical protein